MQSVLCDKICVTDIDEAEAVAQAHGLPFNRENAMRIVLNHNGYLPLRLRCVPEGSVVDPSAPVYAVQSTDPALPWVAPHIGTALARSIWYPITVATIARQALHLLQDAVKISCDSKPEDLTCIMLYDFGSRSSTSEVPSAHLVEQPT